MNDGSHITLAIDPGSTRSAYITFSESPLDFGIVDNECLLGMIRTDALDYDQAAIEMVACYGMAVGRDVFETVWWIGRFCEAMSTNGIEPVRIDRADVKLHLCHARNATDSNIRTALIDRFGPGKNLAVGIKKQPGPLYGVRRDIWSALALAVVFADRMEVGCEAGNH